ncbi:MULTISPECIES: hypothetical protein [Vibrio]|uniref:hypothetical protein n=1 Tax=Vibrio TaxID=662 RepID=UPI002075136A|nr:MULTISPECIES: hypothetical protein [Vibrio]USD35543.1 hypothetical protein J8Z27_22285 [Vibrio sp. SCSIO 43186]USD72667.1 hypothetical protein J4N41_22300 [Vibrio sp. SCSIO 43139]USD98881.1 hypothetical protein CTT30_22630 [Vibrio coralliilyticus]
MKTPHPIYPSQTNSFKEKAKSFAELIAQQSDTKTLSSFKRNDYLAQSLGYKGHTDLLKLTGFRKQADCNQPLMLFNQDVIRSAIINHFAQKLPTLELGAIQEAASIMREREAIQSNFNPSFRFPVHMDEATPYMTGSMSKLRDEINASVTRKNHVPVLTFDYSELPKNVFDAFISHDMVKRFAIDSQRSDVEVIKVQPKSKRNDHWKIRVSFDVWGASDIPMDILNDWMVFKEWLLQFNLSGRVHVADRLKNHSFLTYHTQAHASYSLHKLYDDMSSEEDKHLLYVLMNPNKVLMHGDKSVSSGEGWTVEAVFEKNGITDYQSTSYGYVFFIKGISTPIQVKLTPRSDSSFVDFALSHYIRTPEQIGAYLPSNQFGDYYEYALQRAVSSITGQYQIAVNNNHDPDDSWLVENPSF